MGVVRYIKDRILMKPSVRDEQKLYENIKHKFTNNGALVNVADFLRTVTAMYAETDALIGRDRTLTYKELYTRVTHVAKKLSDLGVNKRDTVLLYYENSVEFYIFYFAVWQIGAIVVPANIFLHDKELSHIIKDAQPKAILTMTKHVARFQNLVTQEFLPAIPPLLTEHDIDWSLPLLKHADFSSKHVDPSVQFSIDELCLLLYTSGTTGVPKGVMLSSRNVLINAMQDYARLRMFSDEKERFFAILPLFHVFAQNTCMWLPLMTGSTVIIAPGIDRRHLLEGLNKKPTLFFGFPALFGLLCLMKNAPLDSIKRFISGADAMPDKIRSAFAMIYGRKICAGYGLTEAAPVIAINHDNELLPTNFVGRPLQGIACSIRDDMGKELPLGEVGTLWIHGDNVMLGYYHTPEETAKVLRDGWLNTGDLGMLDRDGNLAISGRSKDLIIHKGFNIYPQEVENVLLTHPSVFKAAVIGMDEAVVGQVPIAYVATKNNKVGLEKDLRDLCANQLAAYKIPRKIICVEDLPMSATGKVDKKQLRTM